MNTRRQFLLAGAASLGLAAFPAIVRAGQASARIVIVGGGVGGATAAKYLKLADPTLQVTVIEKNPVYIRPYGSSEVLNQHTTMQALEVSYDALRQKHGVAFVFDAARSLDPVAKTVTTAGGKVLAYDKLIVSPGIKLRYDSLPGYSEQVAETQVPSGWIAGAQTALLAKQLQSMRDGGTFVIAAPPNPYRCPPGPYERAALMTEWFSRHNPRAKVIIADPKDSFVTDETAMLGWNRLYGFQPPEEYRAKIKAELKPSTKPCMLEWVQAKAGGTPQRLDAKTMTLHTADGAIKADVINIIPAMVAGQVAFDFGLTNDSGFCPVHRTTFESTRHKDVHVIGDSSIADAMPKSGFSANTQAKWVARVITDQLAGRSSGTPVWENTCYALAGKNYGLFVADVFKIKEDGKIGRVNKARYLPFDATPAQIRLSAVYQQAWLQAFTQDIFA
ncbi:FCSD flavin-binding domain-containing protein [Thiomonas bhubaneswarensis]|uniref:Sulfide dehydrogenase (Flavocytochrome c), flavoprotein subunit n=1 Tax=Thiomonas bhubaneswarensis TaxID=339866 RepID=A0A0K6I5S7_9BURK|nr:NAD(P)/FAD-dependent oxidoreductase [Thiomonas bhubaneswarensis]CUA98490.1 sulfide dehydrogenase (flavocytochrome c), flavoprotein subunit [Thiomonas bhubaneswarensis]